MKELKIIKQQEVLGKDFKVYGDFENPLFLAKDVAEWIEHNNITLMLKNVDEDEKIKLKEELASALNYSIKETVLETGKKSYTCVCYAT